MPGRGSSPLPRRAARAASAWVSGGGSDRERFAGMRAHLGASPLYGFLIATVKIIAALTYGWPVLASAAFATLVVALSRLLRRRGLPEEVATGFMLVFLQVDLAFVVILTDGVRSPLLPLLVIPVITLAVCFRTAVTTLSAALAAASVLLASVVPLPAFAMVAPPGYLNVAVMSVTILCATISARNLARSDTTSRGQAHVDAMTGLYNRRALSKHFLDLQATAPGPGQGGSVAGSHPTRSSPVADQDSRRSRGGSGECPGVDDTRQESADAALVGVGVVLVDLDRFKAVNDVHGHARGDLVLHEVAGVLRRGVRESDRVYRLGGEEFVVLAPAVDVGECLLIAERLRAAVARHRPGGLDVTVSVGLSVQALLTADLQVLLAEADEALYRAKAGGRDRVVTAQPDLRAEARPR